jgi:hypothetical protein
VERDYWLYWRVILGVSCLGLLIVAGCVGPYLLWGPHFREASFQRQKAKVLTRAWTYQGEVTPDEFQREWDAVGNELEMMADK